MMHPALPYVDGAKALLKTKTPRMAEPLLLQALAVIRGETPGSQGELGFETTTSPEAVQASAPRSIEELYQELASLPRVPPMTQERADFFVSWGKEGGLDIWPYSCLCDERFKDREKYIAHRADCEFAKREGLPEYARTFCDCGKSFTPDEKGKHTRHAVRCKKAKEKREEAPNAECTRCEEVSPRAEMREINGGLVCYQCVDEEEWTEEDKEEQEIGVCWGCKKEVPTGPRWHSTLIGARIRWFCPACPATTASPSLDITSEPHEERDSAPKDPQNTPPRISPDQGDSAPEPGEGATTESPSKCEVCGDVFQDEAAFLHHVNSHLMESATTETPDPEKWTERADLVPHVVHPEGYPYPDVEWGPPRKAEPEPGEPWRLCVACTVPMPAKDIYKIQEAGQARSYCASCLAKVMTVRGDRYRKTLSKALSKTARSHELSDDSGVLCPGCGDAVTEQTILSHACERAKEIRREYHDSGTRKSYKTLAKETQKEAP